MNLTGCPDFHNSFRYTLPWVAGLINCAENNRHLFGCSGFDQLLDLIHTPMSWPLLHALMAFWNGSSNTFNLPCGETLITCEEVSSLLGLAAESTEADDRFAISVETVGPGR